MEARKKLYILPYIFYFLLAACQPGQTAKTGKQTSVTDTGSFKSTVTIPPDAFILDLEAIATTILSLQLIKVDTVRGTTKIFTGIVLKNYKGDYQEGSTIYYAGMSEREYRNDLLDTVVVFLMKHKKPLPNLNRKEIYYSTVEENAIIEPYSKLDSLLLPNTRFKELLPHE